LHISVRIYDAEIQRSISPAEAPSADRQRSTSVLPVIRGYSLSTRQGWVSTTRLMAILSFFNRCKLMRSEGYLEYPFQSKTLATCGAFEGKVVDLSYPAKGC
jgi:hypothetical protein